MDCHLVYNNIFIGLYRHGIPLSFVDSHYRKLAINADSMLYHYLEPFSLNPFPCSGYLENDVDLSCLTNCLIVIDRYYLNAY